MARGKWLGWRLILPTANAWRPIPRLAGCFGKLAFGPFGTDNPLLRASWLASPFPSREVSNRSFNPYTHSFELFRVVVLRRLPDGWNTQKFICLVYNLSRILEHFTGCPWLLVCLIVMNKLKASSSSLTPMVVDMRMRPTSQTTLRLGSSATR